jgi:hypothetical protein
LGRCSGNLQPLRLRLYEKSMITQRQKSPKEEDEEAEEEEEEEEEERE